MQIKSRLKALRKLFQSNQIDGYIVPQADEYQNEYIPTRNKRLEYITGFTGSNGFAIIMQDHAMFFTDGRYKEQAPKELDHNLFQIYDIAQLKDVTIDGMLGYDPMLFTENTINSFKRYELKAVEGNLVDLIWSDRPLCAQSAAYSYPISRSGEEQSVKILKYKAILNGLGATHSLITAVDSICWLLNLRASDIEFSPVMLCYAIIGPDKIWLFTDNISASTFIFDISVDVLQTKSLYEFLANLDALVAIDRSSCSIGLQRLIKNKYYISDPCLMLKACKNPVEIRCSQDVHIRDGVAVCETISWIYNCIEHNSAITEYDVGLKLTEMRSKQEGYIEDSFPAIAGYQSNGAIVHYRAKKESAKIISGSGVLLIDSGGHYFGGTTDVTRTIAFGSISDEQKLRYTQVLKGHINLSMQKFPVNTSGSSLDVLARMHLWNEELDYAHGTGHGVGNALFVHEGPHRIGRSLNNVALQQGMIVSNEPGFYKSGEYGIRIENLVYIDKCNNSDFLRFVDLTMVPYCLDLINFELLNQNELIYISEYHKKILDILGDKLSEGAKKYVKKNLLKL